MVVTESEEFVQEHCSDCGREAQGLTPTFDPYTNSEVALCQSCLSAFVQRYQFPPGCCE